MVAWYSLYFRSENQQDVAAVLREFILKSGYTEFNPFGLMPGRVYRDAVRLFIAPPRDGLACSAAGVCPRGPSS